MTTDLSQDITEIMSEDDKLRDRLAQYASERVATLRRRSVIYTFGCILMIWATTLPIGLFLTSILLIGEAIDCVVLLNVGKRLSRGEDYKKLLKWATASGVCQCLSLAAATSTYVFIWGQDGTILGVAAVLGMGAINATMILPTNPTVAIFKLVVFGSTPVILFLVQMFMFRAPDAASHLDAHGLMALMCMAYMSYSFSRSAYDNAQKNDALKNSQLRLSLANKELSAHQDQLLKLSMVARRSNDSVILMASDRTVEWVNDAFSKLTGIPANKAVGRNIYDLIHATDGNAEDYREIALAAQNGATFRTELSNKMPDGSSHWVDFQLVPVKGENGDVDFFVTIARDITATKHHSENMRQAREAAEDAARAKSNFLANMSHEIRTPLTGIIGMAELLSETAQSPDQVEFTETIIGSSRSLLTIINDILDLSKLDAGKLEICEAEFAVRPCFEETIRLLAPIAQEKALPVHLHIAEDTPASILADDVRIRQLGTNVIGNAIKFTQSGEINVRVWAETRDSADASALTLHFEVQDTGIGIPEDKLSTIFDEFTQAESSTTRRFGGTGLGLAICKVLTEHMGGEIHVASTFGKGTTVAISLPITALEQQADKADTTLRAPNYDALDLAGLDVLVAEDNKTNRLLIRKFLEPLPIKLRFVEDGFAAVEATLEKAPDLIFMDMSMPEMSGTEATEAIRQSAIKQPCIVALTANAFETERQACFAAGMDDFLTKPIQRRDLVECLQRHVGHRNVPSSAVSEALQAE